MEIYKIYIEMKLIVILIYLTILSANNVEQIKITGNNKTHKSIIIRELQHPLYSPYNESIAIEDRNRIYNLGLFSTVNIYQVESNYVIDLVEGPNYYPFPIIEYDEAKGKNGWSYGGGIMYLNFRGRNEKQFGGLTMGNVKNYFFGYSNPWIKDDHVSFAINVWNSTNIHAVYEYESNYKHISASSGFRHQNYYRFLFTFGYEQRIIDWGNLNSELDNAIPNDTRYEYYFGNANLEYDSRDVILDPEKGIHTGINYSYHKAKNSVKDYSNLKLWFGIWMNIFKNSWNPVLSLYTTSELQFSENLPIFKYKYLGGEDYVKGYSPVPNRNSAKIQPYLESKNIIYNNISVQQTLFPKVDTGGLELGIDWHVFYSFGIGFDQLEDMKIEKLIHGYGVGFVFYMSGFGSMTIDFGFNPYEPDTHIHLSDSN